MIKNHWQKLLLSPSSLDDDISLKSKSLSTLEDIAIKISRSKYLYAEAALLSKLESNNKKDILSLLAYLDIKTRNFVRLNRLIPKLYEDYNNDPFVRSLVIFWGVLIGNLSSIDEPNRNFWIEENNCTHLALAHGQWFLFKKSYKECEYLIESLLTVKTLERDILLAQLFNSKREYQKSCDLLMPWMPNSNGNQQYWRVFLAARFELQQGKNLEKYILQGLNEVKKQEELLDFHGWGCLLNKQPALARHSLLKQRLLGWNLLDPTSVAHLYTTHEMLGETENLIHILPEINSNPIKYLDVYSNLLVHLTSLENTQIKNVSTKLMEAIYATPGYGSHKPLAVYPSLSNTPRKSLKIAWITGDCRYHPVSRFLLGALSNFSGKFTHDHLLVSTSNLDDSMPRYFNEVEGVELIDYSNLKAQYLTNGLRDLNADIAVDLSGWTHGNCAVSFVARVAPVQVNYLGYFGTTGIPSMDWWLGDTNLFPANMNQWHSEKIFRLPRCFIAWSPHQALPEAQAPITQAPLGPVRFGCFNNLRKLSNLTLNTWASILSAIPDSRLILKAPGLQDSMTISLLRRRVIRAGLDLERIDFLPFASSVTEHLSQYQYMDIALDPFPNGGCTTTVEALWMGVPVITLKGKSYVSRMSSAVLRGANLNEWVAENLDNYISLALKYASNLDDLRNSRNQWRNRIQNSSLGDVDGLIMSLENSFIEMNSLN